MGESKRNFQDIIRDYNNSYMQYVHDEAVMYEDLRDTSSKNKQ